MKEKTVEANIVKWAKRAEVMTYKFTSPSRRSVPDRIFFYKGRVALLEVKAPGNKPTPAQARELARFQQQGISATWADNADEAITWLTHTLGTWE